ncbi:DUF305 domain-containing protein [Streptosporangium saharense]|uniref:Uncharacterized protein (DUF305 family) n=1 Tax=Streptosporangium saharense TaxID=1706840 RepID=A0A7W7VRJ3_9ACTN|nr:DUF305 domain-containing protein [Streptosporangium saharense]MBB4919783.1 uncharacterized protein (DUF305 family) [Streptosporangium saharense]
MGTRRTRAALTAASLGAGAVLTACAPGLALTAGPPAGAPAVVVTDVPNGEHNAQDVIFAQRMIQHHRQTLIMAEMARKRARNPEVRATAERIERTQTAEIARLTAWLKEWGDQVPAPDPCMSPGNGDKNCRGADDVGPGADRGPYVMDPADLEALSRASDADFDRMFLNLMIRHHSDEIALAGIEQRDGLSPRAKALAASITKARTAEIVHMRSMLVRF